MPNVAERFTTRTLQLFPTRSLLSFSKRFALHSNIMAGISKQALRKEIAVILKDADLSTTSAKKVRQELEEKLNCKLISRKTEIDDLVMEYLNKAEKDKNESEEDEEEEEEKESEEEDSEEEKKPVKRAASAKKPPAKRAKKDSDDSEASASGDESEEEYKPEKKSAAKPRGRKSAQKKKKGSDSEGDEDWVRDKPARKSGGAAGGGGGGGKGKGYTRQLTLSPELAELMGQEMMARHEVVKKLWAIIKEKNLYDPKNKQFAICDDALQKVIGVKRFRMFGMMKYLKDHFIA